VGNADAAQRFLDDRPGTRSIFDNGLFLFSREGRIISEAPYLPGRRGRDVSFRGFYKTTVETGKPVISAPYISTHTPGAPAVMFTAPVRDKDGRLIAILGGSVNLLGDNFLGELSRTRIARNGYLYLFAADRTMIMHPDRTRIMNVAAQPGVNKLLDRALTGFEGADENVNSKGVRALTAVKHLQATDWIIAAIYPLSEAYDPIYRAQKLFIAALAMSVSITLLVVRMMMGRFTNDLVRFARHVKQISSKSGADRLFRSDARDEIGLLARTFNAMIQAQDSRSEELLHVSTHDALSGLYNRAYFDEEMKRLSAGRVAPVSVVMADIDYLKVCNDTHGHAVGDALVKATARILLESFRAEDAVARIGGDEFAVLLPGVDAANAAIAVKRVKAIADRYKVIADGVTLSLSLGCATAERPADLEEAFRLADQQMYHDKISRKVEANPNSLVPNQDLMDNDIPILN
jgi:diguanylate cyclase (GGDEF)-like protein